MNETYSVEPSDKVSISKSEILTGKEKIKTPLGGDIPLSKILDKLVKEAELYEKLDNKKVHCYACQHNCKIPENSRGICQVRYNKKGALYSPFNYIAALQLDPIEKKPLFHVYPGINALTFGMMGCDFHCAYCQNWNISQTLRNADAGVRPRQFSAENIIQIAKQQNAQAIVSSYNEPLITSEWSQEIFKLAKKENLITAYISNGNASIEALEYIRPNTDCYKVDLKSFNEKNYRKLGGQLKNIINSIENIYKKGFWLELVTLLIPGFNDSKDEIKNMARFIKNISPDIPWHISAFHKDYKMKDPNNTEAKDLIKAVEIAYSEGLNFVYAGNRPGQVKNYQNTYCPKCKQLLVERIAYVVTKYNINSESCCNICNHKIPGLWSFNNREINLGKEEDIKTRRPKIIKTVQH